jgi:hypothetical protein
VEEKPVYARDDRNRWMAYTRVADENILANVVQLRIWTGQQEAGEEDAKEHLLEYTRKEKILLSALERAPGASLAKLGRDTGFKRKELVSLMTKLVRFDVVEMVINEGYSGFRLRESPGE